MNIFDDAVYLKLNNSLAEANDEIFRLKKKLLRQREAFMDKRTEEEELSDKIYRDVVDRAARAEQQAVHWFVRGEAVAERAKNLLSQLESEVIPAL